VSHAIYKLYFYLDIMRKRRFSQLTRLLSCLLRKDRDCDGMALICKVGKMSTIIVIILKRKRKRERERERERGGGDGFVECEIF